MRILMVVHKDRLNLLPEEELSRLARAQRARHLMRYAVLVLVLLSALLATLKAWEATLAEEHALSLARAELLETNLAPFADLRTDAALIGDRLATADLLAKNRLNWTDLILALAAVTPENLQIISFTPSEKAGAVTFTLAGTGRSREEIIRFRQALGTTGLFSNLLVENTQIPEGSSDGGVSFSLTGSLGPAAPAPAPPPASEEE